ncbi:MAG: VOC family protein [Catonella sp.]|nr:VOC family protein [Catonella sp.]
MRIHHIGYLVKNIDKSRKEFEKLGFSVESQAKHDGIRSAYIEFLTNGDYRIELIEPDKNSDLQGMMKRFKNVGYHICFEVDNFDETVKNYQLGGVLTYTRTCLSSMYK